MSGNAPSPSQADRTRPVSELVAGAVCLAASVAFLVAARALPEGHSSGDVGPGALPLQIGIFALVCSLAYLGLTLRGSFAAVPGQFAQSHRAGLALGIFVLALVAVPWLGLALAIALASALTTLLFDGLHRLLRAVATGVGIWLIAVLLFQMLLGLPMP
ncbi:tripartite tricarboxylate transporter TctB family protein [Cereibacter changlensis]|uniref:tripartite tricarboxylate transporter TctB family protein n=1 Tax=Cereibacter changlensis TaxID=402884 RepID=UPI00145D58BE|nr:tripartite tricarboxylate transporter TctB family protein [Cereibacter changlensis]